MAIAKPSGPLLVQNPGFGSKFVVFGSTTLVGSLPLAGTCMANLTGTQLYKIRHLLRRGFRPRHPF